MTAVRGGLDMRKTATYLRRFWTDQSGATPAEAAIMVAIVGAILAATVIKVSEPSSQVYLDP